MLADAIRAYVGDWLPDGSPAHVCRDACDDETRAHMGCGLRSRYAGRGAGIAWCPGWLRAQPVWEEVSALGAWAGGVGDPRVTPWRLAAAVALYRAVCARVAGEGER